MGAPFPKTLPEFLRVYPTRHRHDSEGGAAMASDRCPSARGHACLIECVDQGIAEVGLDVTVVNHDQAAITARTNHPRHFEVEMDRWDPWKIHICRDGHLTCRDAIKGSPARGAEERLTDQAPACWTYQLLVQRLNEIRPEVGIWIAPSRARLTKGQTCQRHPHLLRLTSDRTESLDGNLRHLSGPIRSS